MIFVLSVCIFLIGCQNEYDITGKREIINSLENQEDDFKEQETLNDEKSGIEEKQSDINLEGEADRNYAEDIYKRTVINTDYYDYFGECINENPIDKVYKIGPNITTEARIEEAVANRDCWRAEIEYAFSILEPILEDEQYDALLSSYEDWTTYMEQFNGIEKELFYLGGSAADPETYPHVTEAEAARTKDYAVQILEIELAVTGEIDFVFDNE